MAQLPQDLLDGVDFTIVEKDDGGFRIVGFQKEFSEPVLCDGFESADAARRWLAHVAVANRATAALGRPV